MKMESFFSRGDIELDLLPELYSMGVPCKFARGMPVFSQAEWTNRLYLVVNGYARYKSLSEKGDILGIFYLGPGCFIGIPPYFDGGRESLVTIEAATKLECCAFSQEVMPRLNERKEVRIAILRSLMRKTRIVEEQINRVAHLTAEQRIVITLYDLMKNFGVSSGDGINIAFKITTADIAGISGCSLETVNRFMKKAREQMILERVGHNLYIKKPFEIISRNVNRKM